MKYVVRTICAIVGFFAFMILVGEPTEEVTMMKCILMKAASIVVMWGVFKAYMCTLSEQERKELEDERV